ncbi:FAD-dependent oxidoreductase [Luteibacter yeojuensis]|uniref:FAD-dependent oxidoreductase n=1 Tax=Luteibacter yeojuensis TaxID=345309 RepID=UPI000695F003|nr:FAD-dependent monooxygenase [Luteibacter yeojuensis]
MPGDALPTTATGRRTMNQPSVLIAGAGPTGLAAALLLARRGIHARIVDAAGAPAPHSRALVVNPRTLDLLAGTGVTERMVDEGRDVRGVRFHENGKELTHLEAGHLHPRYGLTVLSQERSEALLTAALADLGIQVERGVQAALVSQDAGGADVQLGGGEAARFDAVYAADGAHSAFRKALGIDFPGSAFPEEWPLFDVPMDTPLDLDHAHILFFPDGMAFALALDRLVWRIIASVPDPLSRLPEGTTHGEPVWSSRFRIAHRVAPRCALGRVALGGDAAHIHSPIGARGMNLGIEDAATFAMRLAGSQGATAVALDAYHRERHPVHRSVVRRIRAITTMARGHNAALRMARHALLPAVAHVDGMRTMMLRTVAGLDHPPPAE